MKGCRYHQPDWLSDPERYAQRHCRGDGPPKEKARSGELRASERTGQGRLFPNDTTRSGAMQPAHIAAIEGLQRLYGKGGGR